MAFVGKLKGFDLHPKFREEFMEKTRSGGVGTAGIAPISPAEWLALILVCGLSTVLPCSNGRHDDRGWLSHCSQPDFLLLTGG